MHKRFISNLQQPVRERPLLRTASKAERDADVHEAIRHRIPNLGRERTPGKSNGTSKEWRPDDPNRRRQIDIVQCVSSGEAIRQRMATFRSPSQAGATQAAKAAATQASTMVMPGRGRSSSLPAVVPATVSAKAESAAEAEVQHKIGRPVFRVRKDWGILRPRSDIERAELRYHHVGRGRRGRCRCWPGIVNAGAVEVLWKLNAERQARVGH